MGESPKRPYAKPSFRILFPEIRTTKNFRSTKRRILQELQTNFKNKAIRNLSSHHLSQIETEVLALGLNFVPTPPAPTHHLVQKSAIRLIQTMQKQFHFRNRPLTTKRPTYCKPSTWIPPEPDSPNLTLFLEQTQNHLPNLTQHFARPNLTSEQRSTLKNLGSNPDLVIKPFDEGSGICLMDTSLYVSKIEEHLADPTTYKELNSDPTQAIRNDALSTLDYLHMTHRIDDETKHHLTPPKPARTPLFYGLPKVHKPNIPLRPIVSACDSPTDQLSNYVTHFIQPLVEILPSYIRDSKHFLQLLESLPPLPENAILVTADVTSLYTNIPHEEGIESVLHYMKLHANTLPPDGPSPHTIGILLETILKNNNLSFMDKHFLQLVGTAMGTKAAPPYANLFMGRHEETIREAFIWAIPFWKRFIDDIFLIFLGTTEQLQSMKDFMNNLHPTIKFTFEHSTHEISFLDMKILIGTDRKLSTTLHRKPTDCAALLHFHSNHSLKCKESIVFSQALRYNLLITDDTLLQKELDSLAISLLTRQYPLEIITRNISKALLHSRETLLHRPPKTASPKRVLPIVTPYSPEGRHFSQSVRNRWHIIENDSELQKVWSNHPITAYHKTKSLKDILVHSRLTKPISSRPVPTKSR